MPIFEYTCTKCGKQFEELVFKDEKVPCPDCGTKKTEKLVSRCAFKSGGEKAPLGTASTSSSSSCAGCSGGSCSTCK